MTAPGGIAWHAITYYPVSFSGGGALSAAIEEDTVRRAATLPGSGILTAELTTQIPCAPLYSGVGKLLAGAWNAVAGCVQGLAMADLLDEDSLAVLLAPWHRVTGTA